MVFGTKREHKPDTDAQEDVIGTLYPPTYSSEAPMTAATIDHRRDAGDESVIDPHARFNGKYMSDRDLRIEGEAQGEIECMGTLIIAPQARVRAAIKALHVIINGDYEGEVDCGGRFEIGSTGRVRGKVKTQVLVVKEGAHWEGSVIMTTEASRAAASAASAASAESASAPAAESKPAASSSSASATPAAGVFPKEPATASAERAATGPGAGGQ